MILTPSDVASSSRWLSFWEVIEYASEAVVFLGCVGEFIAEYTKWRTEEYRHALGRRSLVFLTLGIGIGLLSLIQTNALSSVVLESLGQKAEQVGKKAQLASETADAAIIKSAQATAASGDAVSTSNKAEGAASNALVLARGARKEADSFEKDIVSAKEQAAKAEAHLAEALQRAANAEAQALKVRQDAAPRRLTEEQKRELIKLLSATPPFTVSFESRVFSGEVDDFADDLIDVFVRMKLMPAPSANRGHSLGTTARGVLVGVLSEKQYPPAAEVFINTLRSWGFDAGAVFPPVVAVRLPTEMRIWVAPKQ